MLDELLQQLLDLGCYERVEEPTNGRPAVRYRRKPTAADATGREGAPMKQTG